MTREEAATNLTLAAIQNDVIAFRRTAKNEKEDVEDVNNFNAQQICNFLKNIYEECDKIGKKQ